jgi:hypothetical protein
VKIKGLGTMAGYLMKLGGRINKEVKKDKLPRQQYFISTQRFVLTTDECLIPNTSCSPTNLITLSSTWTQSAIRQFRFSSPSIRIVSITSLFLQSGVKRPESLVGQALEISPPENDPLRIFGLPKNRLVEVSIFLSAQCR